jgi:hypothetical protein
LPFSIIISSDNHSFLPKEWLKHPICRIPKGIVNQSAKPPIAESTKGWQPKIEPEFGLGAGEGHGTLVKVYS